MNIRCERNLCNHNTGFSKECMYGLDKELIRKAMTKNEKMCPILRNEVVKMYELFFEVIREDLLEKAKEMSEERV